MRYLPPNAIVGEGFQRVTGKLARRAQKWPEKGDELRMGLEYLDHTEILRRVGLLGPTRPGGQPAEAASP